LDFKTIDCGTIPAAVNISRFCGDSGVEEYHLIVRPVGYGSMEDQLEWVYQAYQKALEILGLQKETAVLRRFFCSDLMNQAGILQSHSFSDPHNIGELCAVSWICQPSVPPVKVALWAYHINDPKSQLEKTKEDTALILKRDSHSHYWRTGMTCVSGQTSYDQTQGILENYLKQLQYRDMTLAENVIRTWFFVQNIDANYQGLVVARRELFAQQGLTPQTHFIASTGIEGTYSDVNAKVIMDAYAISGVQPNQIQYLAATDYLSPTHIYGVTFERGTAVSYQDRKHIFISGTASIDSKGNILYPGDIQKQLARTVENVEALLTEAGGTLQDMGVLIVYVRDLSDFGLVRQELKQRFGDIPLETIVAPVCRPGWLIEMETIAIVPAVNPGLPKF